MRPNMRMPGAIDMRRVSKMPEMQAAHNQGRRCPKHADSETE
jgi:hypothetical protein